MFWFFVMHVINLQTIMFILSIVIANWNV